MKKSILKVLILTFSSVFFASALVPFPALAAGTGTLVITTQDTSKKQVDAPISVDNVQQGTGKVTVAVTAGTHEVKFGDLTGYSIVSPRSGKKTVTVKTGKKTSVAATYKKSSSGGGGTTGGGVAGPTVTDIDGNVYNSVVIGTQTWMKENLKVTKFLDGAAIGSALAYDSDNSNAAIYGRLYSWYDATDSRGFCPTGWHLPTSAEWTTLTTYLGGVSSSTDANGWIILTVAGGHMKEAGTTHWNSPNTGADNSSGFTALPAGGFGVMCMFGLCKDTFSNIHSYTAWWSATENTTAAVAEAWAMSLYNDAGNAYYWGSQTDIVHSVRCVRGADNTGGRGTGPQVTDIDGNVYNSVVIGAQTWMKENLKVTKYRDGTAIGTTTTVNLENETSPAYQWAYNGDESNVAAYGRLYTWYAATDSRGFCPTGWHLPTDAEWTTLTAHVGGSAGIVAGGHLKEDGTTHWSAPNTYADNRSGFTALPGGSRDYRGGFGYVGEFGYWWSATESSSPNAWLRDLGSNEGYGYSGDLRRRDSNKGDGYSVRCARD